MEPRSRRKRADARKFEPGTPEYIAEVNKNAINAPNLVECFIAAMVEDGWTISHLAVGRKLDEKTRKPIPLKPSEQGYLNKKLKMLIGYSRLREWANGKRPLPEAAAKLMEQKVATWALKKVGAADGDLSVAALKALVARTYPWIRELPIKSTKTVNLTPQQEKWLIAALAMPKPMASVKKTRATKSTKKSGAKAKSAAKKSAPARKTPAKRAAGVKRTSRRGVGGSATGASAAA